MARIHSCFRLICGVLLLSSYILWAPAQASEPQKTTAVSKPSNHQLLLRPGLPKKEFLDTSNVAFAFFPTKTNPGLVFVNSRQGLTSYPGIILHREKGHYRSVTLDWEAYGWIKSYTSYDRKHVWAVADSIIEGPAWELYIVHSKDGGQTWNLAAPLRKPYFEAELQQMRMRADGSGELIVLNKGDPADTIDSVKPGYYTYQTHDWGDSWGHRYSHPISSPAPTIKMTLSPAISPSLNF